MSMVSNRKPGADTLKSPVELVRLDTVEMDEDDEILPDFEAEVDGRRVWVTAVLERTAVIEPAPGEPKVLVNRRRLFVDPRHLRVRHLAIGVNYMNFSLFFGTMKLADALRSVTLFAKEVMPKLADL